MQPSTVPTKEDGSRLWLRYDPVSVPALAEGYRGALTQIVAATAPGSATLEAATRELGHGLRGLLGLEVPLVDRPGRAGALVVGTPASSQVIAALGWEGELSDLGPEGFVIRPTTIEGRPATVIASAGDVGVLYGVFHFLRLIQTQQPIAGWNLAERPRLQQRLLNHWDNLDGTIERGYAGRSLWRWDELPEKLSPRYADYARACASIGINGCTLNNVNANPKSLSAEYVRKAAAIANVLRTYGMRVYLSANFAAPKLLGNLPTADPLDAQVIDWWKRKVDEIYALIPDFGGFLVKANSEGQPGPQDYQRTHAHGANVLADALAPHSGIVMWRAFVYDQSVDSDRAKRAYLEFKPLDGKFRDNVIGQVKNGPIDFQPREPFHPLFGAMPHTPLMAELQITQEYLGQSNHLVYLATMWKEFLDSDTFAHGEGSTVARVIEGAVDRYRLTGMAGVANTGSDANWCGHHFAAANWYAFGRLAWDPRLPAEHIADEWARMTFTNDAPTVETIRAMMLASRETFVSHTMPLGLHHLIGGDHYAPMPWNDHEPRPDWTATYYHQADVRGIGFDRTTLGDRAVEQYFPKVRDLFDSLEKCPEKLLLWFHHLPWDYKMHSGRALWDELCWHYHTGAERAQQMERTWQTLKGRIDEERHSAVAAKLATQSRDAADWRDKCIAYFDHVRSTRK